MEFVKLCLLISLILSFDSTVWIIRFLFFIFILPTQKPSECWLLNFLKYYHLILDLGIVLFIILILQVWPNEVHLLFHFKLRKLGWRISDIYQLFEVNLITYYRLIFREPRGDELKLRVLIYLPKIILPWLLRKYLPYLINEFIKF